MGGPCRRCGFIVVRERIQVLAQEGDALNGQGGLFQTYAIRGLSRHRVGSSFLGVPIYTERRAGTSASFIDPVLLESMTVVRGPATLLGGSGHLGGMVRAIPATQAGQFAVLGYSTAGDENRPEG